MDVGIDWARARVKHAHNKVVYEHIDHPTTPFKFGKHEIELECKFPTPCYLSVLRLNRLTWGCRQGSSGFGPSDLRLISYVC